MSEEKKTTAEEIEQLLLDKIKEVTLKDSVTLAETWVMSYRTFKEALSHDRVLGDK